MRIDLFFLGCVHYRVHNGGASELFALLGKEEISPKALKRDKKTGDICFFLYRADAVRFERVAQSTGVEIVARLEGGLPAWGKTLAGRPGLWVGFLLALALLCGARVLLWDIEIVGCERLERAYLEEQLCAAGIYRGCFLPSVDADRAAATLCEQDPRIAYVGINLVGTVACVQIREGDVVEKGTPPPPANLVAGCDGVITLPLVFEGECLVEAGEVVRRGQILAGGVLDTQNHGYRLTRAAGQIFARTTRRYSAHVPFSYEEKRGLGRVGAEVELLFFNSAQKVWKNTGNISCKCDIIEKTTWFTLPSGRKLPFGVRIKSHLGYESVSATRSAAEARTLALEELRLRLAEDAATRTLLEKWVEECVDGEGVTFFCTVVCEEDIARTVDISGTPEEAYGTGNRKNRPQ